MLGMGSSHLVAAIAMAAAMIVEKSILSVCLWKVVLRSLVKKSNLSSRWSRRL